MDEELRCQSVAGLEDEVHPLRKFVVTSRELVSPLLYAGVIGNVDAVRASPANLRCAPEVAGSPGPGVRPRWRQLTVSRQPSSKMPTPDATHDSRVSARAPLCSHSRTPSAHQRRQSGGRTGNPSHGAPSLRTPPHRPELGCVRLVGAAPGLRSACTCKLPRQLQPLYRADVRHWRLIQKGNPHQNCVNWRLVSLRLPSADMSPLRRLSWSIDYCRT